MDSLSGGVPPVPVMGGTMTLRLHDVAS